MLPHPAQRSYHMVYLINNLYEPVPWLKHKCNVLLLLEPQAPNLSILELILSLYFLHLIASQHLKRKRQIFIGFSG